MDVEVQEVEAILEAIKEAKVRVKMTEILVKLEVVEATNLTLEAAEAVVEEPEVAQASPRSSSDKERVSYYEQLLDLQLPVIPEAE